MLLLKEITRKGVAFLSHLQEVFPATIHKQKKQKIHVAEKLLEPSQVIYICKFYFHDFNNKNAEAFDKRNRS